ncbi:MAG: 6,7-dimethyl-8-ribityllumazine synthase [Prevotellaceae bacterium]|nr:6,7-dimethyl-8-ribityllumazine synthase [Prevotellaceae bacterium]
MSSADHNLSAFQGSDVPSGKDMRFGIVVSEWSLEVTKALLNGALNTLLKHDVKEDHILIKWVPGSYELPLAAQLIAENEKVNAVICLGCVIQGETRHFDFICNAVSQGIMNLNLDYNMPFIFGVLTPNDQQQALERAGGKYGNKGDEAAITALKMAALQKTI